MTVLALDGSVGRTVDLSSLASRMGWSRIHGLPDGYRRLVRLVRWPDVDRRVTDDMADAILGVHTDELGVESIQALRIDADEGVS